MDVDQVEGENKDSDNTLETTALFVTQYIQSTSTSLRKDLYKLLPFFCQFVGKNFGSFTGCSLSEWFILSVNDQSCIFTFGRSWRPKTEKYLAEAECWHFLKLLSICLICSFNHVEIGDQLNLFFNPQGRCFYLEILRNSIFLLIN